MGGFHAGDISRHVDNHQTVRVALPVGANRAQFVFTEGVAAFAVAHLFEGILQCFDQNCGTVAVVLQQLVGHALGGFGADVGQDAECFNQAGKGIGGSFAHEAALRFYGD